MPINLTALFVGFLAAKKRHVGRRASMRDALLASVIQPPMVGVALAAGLAQRQPQHGPRTIPLPAPPLVTGVALSNSEIVLTWTPTSTAASYNVNRTDPAGNKVVTASKVTGFDDQNNLQPTTAYVYTVDALDAKGNTIVSSSSVSVTTPV
jgi:hypothetical protein